MFGFFQRQASGGISRGVAHSGPAILSYGFRPFFLMAGLWAIAAMTLWVAALSTGLQVGGSLGPVNWHAHEMVFGYTGAVLAGFMLTAVPNWTGRLPVSGRPLLVLVLVWAVGRVAFLAPDLIGTGAALLLEAAFLPLLGTITLREIVAGRNWKNLKILLGIAALTAANLWFLAEIAMGRSPTAPLRLAIAAWALLIILVGGRIIPGFTRNWLARKGHDRHPAPFGPLDQAAIGIAVLALLVWTVWPWGWPTAVLAAVAAITHLFRLLRWQGYRSLLEPIVAVMHLAYLMLVAGFGAIAAAAMGWAAYASAIHLLLIGAIGGMTLAIMTRAALGHTGRPIRAGRVTVLTYILLFTAAIARPLADTVPSHYAALLTASGVFWILAFTGFTWTYAPILIAPRIAARK